MARGELPVLVGVGQAVSHWTAEEGVAAAPSYVSLAEQAIGRALQDAGGALPPDAIDTLAMVRTMEDSLPTSAYAFGRAANLPRAVAKAAGVTPETAIYELTGGQSPQALVNEMGGRIYTGESDCALVVGSEVIGAMKAARRAGLDLDLSDESDGPVEDRGLGASLLSRAEIKHGLVVPAYFYALFENAMAARRLETKEAHRAAMARLFKRYSDVAAANPYAQFPEDRSETFLASPSKENYPFADPFLKWHMAQDAVNQAAAVLVMSESRADTFGIPADARVYLHGAGEAYDDHISVRPVIDGSWAMAEALARAFEQANCSPADIALFDLYSCFPCAVFSACEALGIDPDSERRPLTVTGGLPFFGGPGNNYSLHAIASMVEAVRAAPGQKGLVLANGGWMTKEAAAIYSTERPTAFTPAAPAATPSAQIPLAVGPVEGIVETFTIIHGRDGPRQAICFVKIASGARVIASSRAPDVLARFGDDRSAIGERVAIDTDGEVNTVRLYAA